MGRHLGLIYYLPLQVEARLRWSCRATCARRRRQLQERSSSSGMRMRVALRCGSSCRLSRCWCMSTCLQIIPQQLCYNAGIDAIDILNKLRHRHSLGKSMQDTKSSGSKLILSRRNLGRSGYPQGGGGRQSCRLYLGTQLGEKGLLFFSSCQIGNHLSASEHKCTRRLDFYAICVESYRR